MLAFALQCPFAAVLLPGGLFAQPAAQGGEPALVGRLPAIVLARPPASRWSDERALPAPFPQWTSA